MNTHWWKKNEEIFERLFFSVVMSYCEGTIKLWDLPPLISHEYSGKPDDCNVPRTNAVGCNILADLSR